MTDVAIRVENLGKKYKIGGSKKGSFRESISHYLKYPFSKADKATPINNEQEHLIGANDTALDTNGEFWALKDINFEIKRGEAVGIIGKNGAGKSTLLRILSRITKPTTGRYEVFGRVSSLLEVGTGFHPELTGRENVYLNGTILGMRRQEVKAKFDEIVAFSGVEKFIDTPVKRYSSGMQVRLAFAVAAHLEPEILIIDEVLAVGDAEFQKKCLGKMEEVTGEGRTVLFVSHNMAAVTSLCDRAVFLKNGKKCFEGIVEDTITKYLSEIKVSNALKLVDRKDRKGTGDIVFANAYCSKDIETVNNVLLCGKPAYFVLDLASNKQDAIENVSVILVVKDSFANVIFTAHTRFKNFIIRKFSSEGRIVCRIPKLPLLPGKYKLTLRNIIGGKGGMTGAVAGDHIEDAIEFNVLESDFFGTGELPDPSKHGKIIVDQDWSFEMIPQTYEQ